MKPDMESLGPIVRSCPKILRSFPGESWKHRALGGQSRGNLFASDGGRETVWEISPSDTAFSRSSISKGRCAAGLVSGNFFRNDHFEEISHRNHISKCPRLSFLCIDIVNHGWQRQAPGAKAVACFLPNTILLCFNCRARLAADGCWSSQVRQDPRDLRSKT